MARLRPLRLLAGSVLMILLGAAILWLARAPIADEALRQAMSARGIEADYQIKKIGFRWQRIENLRIGNRANPDLTAQWAEIQTSMSLSGPRISAIRAQGVRLRGKVIAGVVSFGAVDKLLPKADGKTRLRLPDVDLDLIDARVRLDGPWGPVGSRIDGRGNLSNGFAGKIAAVAPSLSLRDCEGVRTTAYMDIRIIRDAPAFDGLVRAAAVRCSAGSLADPAAKVKIAFNGALETWRGSISARAANVRTADAAFRSLSGKTVFTGSANATRGTASFVAGEGAVRKYRMRGISVDSNFDTGGGGKGRATIDIARFLIDPQFLSKASTTLKRLDGTPFDQLLQKLLVAAKAAGPALKIAGEVTFADRVWNVREMVVTGHNNVRLNQSGGRGIELGPTGVTADTMIALGGDGLPDVRATVQRRGDGMTLGLARIAPYAAADSRLTLSPVKFAMNAAGSMRIETEANIDGPITGGRIEGLAMPLNVTAKANGQILINDGCTAVSFRSLKLDSFAIDPATIRLCPFVGRSLASFNKGVLSGGFVSDSIRFGGKAAGRPLLLTAKQARFDFGRTRFSVDQFAAVIGSQKAVSRLSVDYTDGAIVKKNLAGRFSGASGTIADIPIVVDNSSGRWRYQDNALTLLAATRISDGFLPTRFTPLKSENMSVRFAEGNLIASGMLRLPSNPTDIARVRIGHAFATGIGSARIEVPEISFNKKLQPEMLTRLTVGVVANVEGSVSGVGSVRWTPAGIVSTGRFSTDKLDFAAAFGPVSGLKGTIVFDDLIGLTTPPRQVVTVASINPGTTVSNGIVTYQLLPGQRLAVESGAWPFAGGDLLLDPTVLAMAEESDRRLTFRVVGLDAAKFVQQLEFEDLAATGTFDGIMPMIFDTAGGRIEAGRLVVRSDGGTLAYVGDVSNADMNIFAKLAFDALKSIRYKRLTIGLNGPLDGEIISQIYFNGINEAPLSPPKSFISRQFIGLPFVFNIKVAAPFRSLLNTARTLQDPTSLLQRTVPELREPPVQPAESADER